MERDHFYTQTAHQSERGNLKTQPWTGVFQFWAAKHRQPAPSLAGTCFVRGLEAEPQLCLSLVGTQGFGGK